MTMFAIIIDPNVARRFWAKVPSRPDIGCWEWAGCRGVAGYGYLRIGGGGSSPIVASRVSWLIHTGEDPGDKFVLHHCDNPPCIRYHPNHLYLGTHQDNMDDMIKKNRSYTKLNNYQVTQIRELAKYNSNVSISKKFGIANSTVSRIISGKMWKHLLA